MLPPLTQIPEPWRSIHKKALETEDPDWMARYGEESLRAAATLMGDKIPQV